MSTLGAVLLVLGAALAVAEAHVPTQGALGGAAVASLAGGIVLIFAGAGLSLAVALGAGLAAGAIGAGYLWLVLSKVLDARRTRVRTGPEGLLGRVGEVRAVPGPVGQVFVDGALWRARLGAVAEHAELEPGDPVVVEHIDGLTLTVRPAEEWEVTR
jgi:membrane-bound serine protease (ClpP class)